jgi:hypothetical protein
MTGRGTSHGIIVGIALLLAGGAYAQTCDDFNECTANDICADGECRGSFQDGGCDDGNPCTINDRCQMDSESEPFCIGTDPAPAGTACGGGCGTCQPLAPFPGAPVQCTGDPAHNDDPCDPGLVTPCLEGKCQIRDFGGGIISAFCLPSPKVCPDTDGNPCTDGCNFETGQCQVSANQCIPTCERCDPGSGQCLPANVGAACDDFNVCTPQSSCQAAFGRTFCMAGVPTGPTPTATVMSGTPTAPPTPGACVGDCNANGQVAVNELIVGVNIALGSASISQCLAFDRNSSNGVEVNELIGGVNSLLNGCA